MYISDFQRFCIDAEKSLMDAMHMLNDNDQKTLLVEKNDRLYGTLTDGDVRRWILGNGSLSICVGDVCNTHCTAINEFELNEAMWIMGKKGIRMLPVVTQDGKIIGVCVDQPSVSVAKPQKQDYSVVVNAGGKGTRLYPYTKILPKPLVPIGELPISELIINSFRDQGVEDFYMILNYKRNMIKAYFNEVQKDYRLTMIDEDQPLGTGGGITLLRGKLHKTFLFANCDTLITERMQNAYALHKKQGHAITVICATENYIIPYGVVKIDENGLLSSIQEKPQIAYLINTGTYFVEPYVIDLLPDNTPISFPEIIDLCVEKSLKVGVYPISEENWLDMGQLSEMEKMKKRLGVYE